MAGNCIHGFASGNCLICQTLEGGSGSKPSGSRPSKVATTVTSEGRRAGQSRRHSPPEDSAPLQVRPDRVLPVGADRSSTGAGVKLLGVVAVLAIAALVAWGIAGFVFGILHLIEIIVLAGAAGWVGYQVGRIKGRHERS